MSILVNHIFVAIFVNLHYFKVHNGSFQFQIIILLNYILCGHLGCSNHSHSFK
jgi:hypothetical protein